MSAIDRGPMLLPNAEWRLHRDTLARAAGRRRSLREWIACALGRHNWIIDGGSITEPRFAGDPLREFCGRPFCDGRRGDWETPS